MGNVLSRVGSIFILLILCCLCFVTEAYADEKQSDEGRVIAAAAQVDIGEIKSPNGTPTFLYRLDGSDGSVRYAYGRFEAPQMASSRLATYAVTFTHLDPSVTYTASVEHAVRFGVADMTTIGGTIDGETIVFGPSEGTGSAVWLMKKQIASGLSHTSAMLNMLKAPETVPMVSIEWHDWHEGDPTAVFNRIAWNNTACTLTRNGTAQSVPVYSMGNGGTTALPIPYAYISDEFTEEELNEMFVGSMSTWVNSLTPIEGDCHILKVTLNSNPDPQIKNGKTYLKYNFTIGWPTTQIPEAALNNLAEYEPFHPSREDKIFIGWSEAELIKQDASGNKLYKTESNYLTSAPDAEVQVLWRDGMANGDTVDFNRISWNNVTCTITHKDSTTTDIPIYSVGNDGTTSSPDIFCFLPESYAETEIQSMLTGAQVTFTNSLIPVDAGYIKNIYRDVANTERPVKNGITFVKYKITLNIWPVTTIKVSQLANLREVAPYTPTRDGWTFVGWSVPEQMGEDFFVTYAQWEEKTENPDDMTLPAWCARYGNVLVFGRGTTIPSTYEGLTLSESWRDIEGAGCSGENVPWHGSADKITEVQFTGAIRPVTIDSWFKDMVNLRHANLEKLNVTDTVSAGSAFENCSQLEELDLSWFATEKMTHVEDMFAGCTNLKHIYVSSLWTNANMTSSTNMFAGCTSLVGGNGFEFDPKSTDKSVAVIDTDVNPGYLTQKAISAYAAVYGGNTLVFSRGTEAPLTYNGMPLSGMWRGIETDSYTFDTIPWREYRSNIVSGSVAEDITPVSMAYWFDSFTSLESINLEGFNTVNCEDMISLFAHCTKLKTVDVSVLDTSSTRFMGSMFYGCEALETIDWSKNDTARVEGLGNMFYECHNLTSVTFGEHFSTESVQRMNNMFFDCPKLTELDLSSFSTPNVTAMNSMFARCTALKTIYATDNFVTTSVKISDSMFSECKALVGGNGTTWIDTRKGIEYAKIDREGQVGYFTDKNASGGEDPDPKPPVDPDPEEPDPEKPTDDIGRLMADMTLHEKICQMFCVYPENLAAESGGSTVTVINDTHRDTLKKYPFGGICSFLSNIKTEEQASKMTSDLQAASRIPMLTGIDEEGGRVQRIGGGYYDGANRGAGIGYQLNAMQTYAAQGTVTARDNGWKLADNCLRVGYNWDFAPVADVNSNPANTIIGQRAYSSDYAEAASLISAAIQGFHDRGVATSIKHFPGHGDTSTDTHVGAASVTKTKEQLLKEDLVPFTAGIAAGADSVMIGHLTVPHIDGENIATVSSVIVTDLLRKEMGFDGVIVTDGMQMGALTKVYGTTKQGYVNATLACLDAGIDVFLLPGYPRAGVDAIEAKVKSGEISEERIDESCRRILQMKKNIGIMDDILANYAE